MVNESFADYQREGYVLIRNAIKPSLLYDLAWEVKRLVAHPERPGIRPVESDIMALEARDHKLVYEAQVSVGSSLAAHRLVASLPLESYALVGIPNVSRSLHTTPLHVSIQIPKSTTYDYAWHIESDFYPWAPEIMNFWFPILAPTVAHKTGTIEVIPGSHLKSGRPNVKTDIEHYVQIVSTVTETEEAKGIQIEANPCDLLVFHKDMVHRTCPNLCTIPRVTGILRLMDHDKLATPRPLYKALAYTQ